MKPILFRCGVSVFLFVLFVLPSCSASGTSPALLLVGSTPGDGPVKPMLAIPTTANVDFIRWHLSLSGKQSLKDFYRYIKVTPDQAAYQIEKIWKARELMAAM